MARRSDPGTAMERAQDLAKNSKSNQNSKALVAVKAVEKAFDDRRVTDQLARVIPPHLTHAITPEILLANALMEIKANALLQQCTPVSVIGSVIRSARLGLIPDGILGHSYLVPRRAGKEKVWTCNLQLGYRGIALLCYQSNKVIFRCRIISEGDEWEYEEGLNPILRHKKQLNRVDPPEWDDFRLGYSVATFPDGRSDFRIVTIADLEKARKSSDSFRFSPATSPWTKWPEAMAEKTCLIKHSKQLPLSTKTMGEILRDERQEAGLMVQTSEMRDDEVDLGEAEVVDVGPAEVVREEEPPPPDSPEPGGCNHPPAAREDDGSCGACGAPPQ
jgi:recombination protein RecT